MASPRSDSASVPSTFPGERLGLPRSGRGSVARVGRRICALLVDWWIALLVVSLLRGSLGAAPATVSDAAFISSAQGQSLQVLTLFVVLQIVGIPIMGGSIGHRLLGCYVAPLTGGWVGLWRPIVRSLLLALVIPAVVWDSDQRGFHDKIAGTVLLRTS